ncbi:MAG: MATE family efflux transporter [Phycisphaerae bacterium]
MRPPEKSLRVSAPVEGAADEAGLEPSLGTPSQVEGVARRGGGKRVWAEEAVGVGMIMALALPTIVEQLVSALVGVTDTWVAGRTGPDAAAHAAVAAAVGTMTYLQWFAGLMTSALGVGATAIVARSIGARKREVATRVAGTVCSGAFLVGLVTAGIFYFLPWAVVHVFGLHGAAAEYGVAYLRIMSLTVCLQSVGQIGMACLRGAGDTVRPLMVTVAIVVINGVASPALTFGWFGLPAMGVRGNAIGTLLAFAAAGVMTLWLLLSEGAGLRLRLRHFRIVPTLLKRVLRIGMPSWLEGMLLWGGQVAIVMLVISPTDVAIGVNGATMAAHTAVLRVESFAFLPGFGFGIACSTLVGQYLGARKAGEAERAVGMSNRLAVMTMTAAAVPMVLFPRYLVGLLVESGTVMDVGRWPLVLAGLAQPGFAVAIIKSSALKGAGDTVSPMLSTITGMVLRIILVFGVMAAFKHAGHAGWGLLAVWICIFVDLNYRAVYTSAVFRTGKWRFKRV